MATLVVCAATSRSILCVTCGLDRTREAQGRLNSTMSATVVARCACGGASIFHHLTPTVTIYFNDATRRQAFRSKVRRL